MGKAHQPGTLLGPKNILFLKRDEKQRNKGLFKCPFCENTFSAYISNISTGKTQSCGCMTKEMIGNKIRKDISGKRFSHLVAIKDVGASNGHRVWECECDCGKHINTTITNLQTGNTKSCGNVKECNYAYQLQVEHQIPNLKGKRFGKLVVLEKFIQNCTTLWKCQCDCGNIVYYEGRKLTSKHVQSCGCLKSKGEFLIS